MSSNPIEKSHGDAYLTRTRPSDLGTVDTDAERNRNRDSSGKFVRGNDAARHQGATRTLTRSLREAAQDAAGGAIAPDEAREVAQDALTLYGANKRTVGHAAPLVLARLLRNAVNDVVADRLTAEAVKVGLATPAGMALLDLAHKCEARAERAMTAALAFSKALGAKPPKGDQTPPWFEAEGEETTP